MYRLLMGLMFIMLTASQVQASVINFESLSQPEAYGEISGRVLNCSNQSLLEDTLIHIPGKSVSTRLGTDGQFHLHFVPTGKHNLELEVNSKSFGTIENVPVKQGNVTQINSLEVCVTKETRNQSNETASNSRIMKFRCPKGGFSCQSIWHMRKIKEARLKETSSDSASISEPVKYVVNSENQLVRVR